MRRAAFLDRDYTIAVGATYIGRVENFNLYDGAAEAITKLNRAGFLVFVLTNQPGVARAIFTDDDVVKIHEKMKRDIEAAGGWLDGVYYCNHAVDSKCMCRKPFPGLVDLAVQEFPEISLEESYIVGDRWTEMWMPVPCKKVLVRSTETELYAHLHGIDFECDRFTQAVDWILEDARDGYCCR